MPIDPEQTLASTTADGGGTEPSKPRLTVPDHELIRCIGSGAYGEVWLARNVLGRYRAVKVVFRSSFKTDDPYEREFRGIQCFEPISRSNDGLVDILQVGRNDEQRYFYYVMELADDAGAASADAPPPEGAPHRATELAGGIGPTSEPRPPLRSGAVLDVDTYVPRTLRGEQRRHGRLAPELCIELGKNLALALVQLHGHGLIHRDIKPSNIIFVGGLPRLADIGLVTDSSEAQSFVGTEGFIPPEGPNSPQADIYSLGKVLYEISMGKDRHQFPEPATLLGSGPDSRILEELNVIILKACATRQADRYPTAEAMTHELDLLLQGKSVKQRRAIDRYLGWVGKLSAAAALAGLLVAVGHLARRDPAPRSTIPKRISVSGAEFWRGPTYPRQFDFAPKGASLRILFGGEKGISIWDERTGVNQAWKFRLEADWPTAGAPGALPRWAPDGEHFIFRAYRRPGADSGELSRVGTFFLGHATRAEVRQVGPELSGGEAPQDFTWSPDGKSIAYFSRNEQLYTLNLATGSRTLWIDAQLPRLRSPRIGDYAADGNWLAISMATKEDQAREERDIWLVPHGGGRAIELTRGGGMDAYPCWGPEGDTLYYVSAGGMGPGAPWGIWKTRIDLATGLRLDAGIEVFTRQGEQLMHPRFVHQGRALVYAGNEPNSRIWIGPADSLDQGTEMVRGESPALSPDGSTVYFVGVTHALQGLFAISTTQTGVPRTICSLVPRSTQHSVNRFSVAPDGALLTFHGFDGTNAGVFTVPTQGGTPRLIERLHQSGIVSPVWSPDGRWIAFAVENSLWRIDRDGTHRERLATLYRWQNESIRWSPDGRWLAGLGYETPAEWPDHPAVFAVSISDRTPRRLTSPHENKYKEGLEWHPDGARLTYFYYGPRSADAKIRWAFLHEPNKVEEFLDQPDHWDYVGVWAPDGRRFFFHSSNLITREKGVHVWTQGDAGSSISTRLYDGWLPSWSQDGNTRVWTAENEVIRYFEAIDIP